MLKEGHEAEMEPLTRDIDRLQVGMMAMRMMMTMTMTMVTMLMLMMILTRDRDGTSHRQAVGSMSMWLS